MKDYTQSRLEELKGWMENVLEHDVEREYIKSFLATSIAQAEQEGYERGKLSEIENSAVGDIKIVSDKVEQIKAQAIAEERARVVGEIKKQIAIHTQLEKEWTGISLTDFTKSRINPHTERREELSAFNERII